MNTILEQLGLDSHEVGNGSTSWVDFAVDRLVYAYPHFDWISETIGRMGCLGSQ